MTSTHLTSYATTTSLSANPYRVSSWILPSFPLGFHFYAIFKFAILNKFKFSCHWLVSILESKNALQNKLLISHRKLLLLLTRLLVSSSDKGSEHTVCAFWEPVSSSPCKATCDNAKYDQLAFAGFSFRLVCQGPKLCRGVHMFLFIPFYILYLWVTGNLPECL